MEYPPPHLIYIPTSMKIYEEPQNWTKVFNFNLYLFYFLCFFFSLFAFIFSNKNNKRNKMKECFLPRTCYIKNAKQELYFPPSKVRTKLFFSYYELLRNVFHLIFSTFYIARWKKGNSLKCCSYKCSDSAFQTFFNWKIFFYNLF